MKTIHTYCIFFAACFLVVAVSCKKDTDVDRPLVFSSLTAENDTLFPGGSTTIIAVADGDGITYSWSATAGDVVGSGPEINYVSPPCTVGNNDVTCIVRDKADNTLSKTITIVVL
jgi:hypothetical protein